MFSLRSCFAILAPLRFNIVSLQNIKSRNLAISEPQLELIIKFYNLMVMRAGRVYLRLQGSRPV